MCSDMNIYYSKIHCCKTTILGPVLMVPSLVEPRTIVTERHVATHRVSHLRIETRSAKLEVCLGSGRWRQGSSRIWLRNG